MRLLICGSRTYSNRRVMKRVVIVLLMIVCIVMVSGCKSHTAGGDLPVGAVVTNDLGNGWVIFKLDGKPFLYHHEWAGYKGYECITQIHE